MSDPADPCGYDGPAEALRPLGSYSRNPWPFDVPDEMAEFYLEAARRLPIADIPVLGRFLSNNGLAVGLFHPVTNIILTTIKSFATWPADGPQYCSLSAPAAVWRSRGKATFAAAAGRSRTGLVHFMLCYFRFLSVAQALAFLDMAQQDLLHAVCLVEYGIRGDCPGLLPRTAEVITPRTKTAFEHAACSIHSSMQDFLSQLMTSRYPCRLLNVIHHLGKGDVLTADSVYKICDLLREPWSPPPPTLTPGTFLDRSGHTTVINNIGEDLFFIATIFKGRVVTARTVSLAAAASDTSSRAATNGEYDYLSSILDKYRTRPTFTFFCWYKKPEFLPLLKMHLIDTLHGYYTEALAKLSVQALRQDHLVRAILVAGHCYGPMGDPVTNIVFNSIWYHAVFPLPDDVLSDAKDVLQEGDILDARSLPHLQSRSLDGLIALLCESSSISEQEAVVLLCQDLNYAIMAGQGKRIWTAVALAAKHPQPVAYAAFIESLTCGGELRHIVDLIAATYVGGGIPDPAALRILNNMLRMDTPAAIAEPGMAPDLCPLALDMLSTRRSELMSRQAYVRQELEKLLLDFGDKEGGNYKLGVICGVAATNCDIYTVCYHVNFLALSDANEMVLFFGQFWNHCNIRIEEKTKLPFCCPVPHHNQYLGRCIICEYHSTSRIVHPSSYFMGSDLHNFRIHLQNGADYPDETLDSDFIYFDPKRNVEFTKLLSEKATQRPTRFFSTI